MAKVRKIVLETVSTFGMEIPDDKARELVDGSTCNPWVIVVAGQPFQVVEVEMVTADTHGREVTENLRPTSVRYSA